MRKSERARRKKAKHPELGDLVPVRVTIDIGAHAIRLTKVGTLFAFAPFEARKLFDVAQLEARLYVKGKQA